MKLWIARDVCNIRLKLFFEKPVEQEGNWWDILDNKIFPFTPYQYCPRCGKIRMNFS